MARIGGIWPGEALYVVGGPDLYGQYFAFNYGSKTYDVWGNVNDLDMFVTILFRDGSGVYREGFLSYDDFEIGDISHLSRDSNLGARWDEVYGYQDIYELKSSAQVKDRYGNNVSILPSGTRIASSSIHNGQTYTDYMYFERWYDSVNKVWQYATGTAYGFIDTGIKTSGSDCSKFKIKHKKSC